ncbi:MAG: hypothetical protein N2508_05200 [Anaerolineae bacterium]|nr:hypothetical protein [Anaerolineae bacterium]
MSESVRDLLVRGIAAAKGGEKAEARYYLAWALRLDPSAEQRLTAWLWLSRVSDDPVEKRRYLEDILNADPTHPEARRALAILEGRLRPDEIIDPNRYTAAAPETPQPAQAQQFFCPRCGGRMVYNPQGQLICEYCEQRQATLTPTSGSGAIVEHDFILALATARGHTSPVATRCVHCRGCGASFTLPPEQISFTCPYCTAAYSVEQMEEKELIPPTAIVPFAIDWAEAERIISHWLTRERLSATLVTPLTGMYFPAWTFDVQCTIEGSYMEHEETWLADDVPVLAGRKLSALLEEEIGRFNLSMQVAYDPRYLAGWPAETYQISPADASLIARQKVVAYVRRQRARDGEAAGLSLSLSVLSFKLILLPLWVAYYRDRKGEYTVIVNGQTGALRTDRPGSKTRVG